MNLRISIPSVRGKIQSHGDKGLLDPKELPTYSFRIQRAKNSFDQQKEATRNGQQEDREMT
jgi:hypothetical protein